MTGKFKIAIILALGLLAGIAANQEATIAVAEVPTKSAEDSKMFVYVGTYTEGRTDGIFRFDFDPKTGSLSNKKGFAVGKNPSFLAIAPDKKHLYCIGEVDNVDGKKGGGATAVAIDSATGDLTKLNTESTVGVGPCHISLDKTGRVALVANYGGGSVASLPIAADGKIEPAATFVQHEVTGEHAKQKKQPRGHSINVSPDNRFAFAADLGCDKVFSYKLDPATGKMSPNDPQSVDLAFGAGPRHFAFHPSGKFAFVINELDSTMTAFKYDAEKGMLTVVDTISTLPTPGVKNSTAEVQVHPSGKFVYGSNRGHDSIVVYSFDEATGKLTTVEYAPTEGKMPRNFTIDPTGEWIIAGNMDSNSIIVYKIDQSTGKLTKTGPMVELDKPVCFRFMER